MTKPANTSAFASKTGKSWEDWITYLDGIGARDLSHKEIASRIVETGEASGWWAQGITVAYEQHIGRRQPGQRPDGSHEVSVSKTMGGSLDEVLVLWEAEAQSVQAGNRVEFDGPATVSESGKWRYWRRPLADGSRLSITIAEKPGGKTSIAVTHEKLPGREAAEDWRGFWKSALSRLASGINRS